MTVNDDVWRDLVWRAECPAQAIHVEILRAQTQLLRERPDGVSFFSIGSVAWASITQEQRREAFGWMLELYARTICSEANQRDHAEQLGRDAADATKTYIDSDDVHSLWDSVFSGNRDSEDCGANRDSLTNVLSELELLQHRLAMREPERP